MDNIVLTSIPVGDLQSIIIDCVTLCLSRERSEKKDQSCKKAHPVPDDAEILSVRQASDFLKLAVPTIYKYCGDRSIPHVKKGGKLLFLKKDLIMWAEDGRQKTAKEIKQDSEAWLGKLGEKKGG